MRPINRRDGFGSGRLASPWNLFFAGMLLWLALEDCRAGTPNVLFIAVDDLKPTLGCYGDTTAVTPNIDRLASRGTVFLNAHCQWPVCGPTRASLMTSQRPEATGVMDLKTSMRAKNPGVITLSQHFIANGYKAAGTGKIYDPRCVDDRKTADSPSWSIPFILPKSQNDKVKTHRFALAPDLNDVDLTDGRITQDGIKLMRRLGKSIKPFFLAVGFKKPHLPFVAPKRYWDLYQRDQFALATHRGGIQDASGYSLHDSSEMRGYGGIPEQGPMSDDLQREAIHGYYACTSYVDAQVGLLLAELNALGLSDNTCVVLWGDHGFHLGDHQMWGKHSTLEQATRVPLIVCAPPSVDTIEQTAAPVEFTDVFPTLCSLADIDTPAQVVGHSLMPLMDGSATKVRDGALTVFKSKGSIGYSYRSKRYRYTEWINKRNQVAAAELYDYQLDPLETRNLAADPKYTAIRDQLAAAMRREGDGCDRLLATDSEAIEAR